MQSLSFIFLVALLVVSTPIPIAANLANHSASTARFVSFSGLPRDFVPRKPTGSMQPLPLPAPTGLASYGSAGGGNLTTYAVKGSITFYSLDLGIDVIPPPYASNFTPIGTGFGSLQENAVLWIPGHGEYWTQNVLFLASNKTVSPEVELINNIWNFSSTTAAMNGKYVKGNGNVSSPGFYYYVDPVVYNLTFPFTVNLSMEVETTSAGAAQVAFEYSIESGNGTIYSGTYDSVVLFPGAPSAAAYYQMGSYAPIGLPSDLEYVLGGPGGGSFAVVQNIAATESLYYGAGSSYAPVPEAYSYGSDTGETVYYVTAQRDFSDPATPQATLGFGNLNAYQLWPVSPILQASVDPALASITVEGQLVYPQSTGSSYSAAEGQTLQIQLGEGAGSVLSSTAATATVVTGQDGEFSATIPLNSSTPNEVVVSYQGNAELKAAYSIAQITVYAITVEGTPRYGVQVDGAQYVLPGGQTSYLALPSGQSATLVVPNLTQVAPGTRMVASLLVNGRPTQSQTVTLTSGVAANITVVGATQYLVQTVQRTAGGVASQSSWMRANSTLNLDAQAAIYTNTSSRYVFQGWMINGQATNTTSLTLAVGSPISATAVYVEQDLVKLTSPLANTTAWVQVGQPYIFSAPQSYGNFLVSYGFKGWSGTYTGSSDPLTVTVDAPLTETATYSPSYTGTIILLVVLFVVGLGAGILVGRARPPRPAAAPIQPANPSPATQATNTSPISQQGARPQAMTKANRTHL